MSNLQITNNTYILEVESVTSNSRSTLEVQASSNQSLEVSTGFAVSANDILNFDNAVSGLLPVTDILAGSNISIVPSGSEYTISVSGNLGLTTEEVDDRVASLLSAGSGILLNYDDDNNLLTINTTGLQPSGDYTVVGHTHNVSDINGFNSSVSGLLPVTNIVGGTNISVASSGTVYTVSVSGQLGLTAEEVDDRVNNFLIAGTGINLEYNDTNNSLTINVTPQSTVGSQLYLSANFQ